MKITKSKNILASCVFFGLVLMNGAINLYDKPDVETKEIDDEAVDHLLPAEVVTAETTTPQALPKNAFRRRHFTAEFLRKVTFLDFVPAEDYARAANENVTIQL